MATYYRSSTIKSKWTKTKWLLGTDVQSYVPKTLPFSQENLRTMLSQYSTVFFKPTTGSGGFNIVRIKKLGSGYQVQHNSVRNHYLTIDGVYRQLLKRCSKRDYLLQKGIQLAKTNGRPFDIRVMVQKPNDGPWTSTAIFTKVGRPGKVATNYHQGGEIGFFQQTLSRAGYSSERIEKKENELKRLGESVGRIFDKRYSGFRELGLDVALDESGKAWILEVNTRPTFYPLRNMGDRSLHRRIMSYARQYGRLR